MEIFKRDFVRYTDAGLPVLYVDTLEQDRAKKIIREICTRNCRNVFEWSLLGAWDYSDGVTMALPKADLASSLQLLIEDDSLDNKTLILQDVQFSPDKPETTATLKAIAQG